MEMINNLSIVVEALGSIIFGAALVGFAAPLVSMFFRAKHNPRRPQRRQRVI